MLECCITLKDITTENFKTSNAIDISIRDISYIFSNWYYVSEYNLANFNRKKNIKNMAFI